MIPCHYFTPVRREPAALRYCQAKTLLQLGLLMLLCCGTPAMRPARAQAGPDNGALLSKSILELFDDLDDIDRLRSLNPLKLTAPQLDKMIAAVSAAKEAYDKAMAELAGAQVKKMDAEIRDVKHKMLLGGTIPADFDERVKKASTLVVSSREKLDMQNLGSLADALREILTPAQIGDAAKLSKDAAAAAGKPTGGTTAQWFNYYVKEILIGYPRILPLLKEMRAAIAPDAKTARVENGAKTTVVR
jgi:hypothetical protein